MASAMLASSSAATRAVLPRPASCELRGVVGNGPQAGADRALHLAGAIERALQMRATRRARASASPARAAAIASSNACEQIRRVAAVDDGVAVEHHGHRTVAIDVHRHLARRARVGLHHAGVVLAVGTHGAGGAAEHVGAAERRGQVFEDGVAQRGQLLRAVLALRVGRLRALHAENRGARRGQLVDDVRQQGVGHGQARLGRIARPACTARRRPWPPFR